MDTWSTLPQQMACFLMVVSRYLNRRWFIIDAVCQSHEWIQCINHLNVFQNHLFTAYADLARAAELNNGVKVMNTGGAHYNDVIISAMVSQITSLVIVYSTVYSGTDQRKHQSSAPLAIMRGIHRWPLNSPHKGPITQKCFHLMTSSWMAVNWLRYRQCRFSHFWCWNRNIPGNFVNTIIGNTLVPPSPGAQQYVCSCLPWGMILNADILCFITNKHYKH